MRRQSLLWQRYSLLARPVTGLWRRMERLDIILTSWKACYEPRCCSDSGRRADWHQFDCMWLACIAGACHLSVTHAAADAVYS